MCAAGSHEITVLLGGSVETPGGFVLGQDLVDHHRRLFAGVEGDLANGSLASATDDVDTGHDNFVYVRLLNRAGSAAANVRQSSQSATRGIGARR